jgi:hypothetical protein
MAGIISFNPMPAAITLVDACAIGRFTVLAVIFGVICAQYIQHDRGRD